MDFIESSKNPKALKITIIILVVVMIACAIGVGAYGIYRVFGEKYAAPNFPTPVVGVDATSLLYKTAAEYGKTRAVCLQGRFKGLVDDKSYWSGFLVSSDGYIATSYSRANSGTGIVFMTFTDYVVKMLDSDGIEHEYLASPTNFYNKTTDIMLIKIKDVPIGKTFEYFDIAPSSSVTFGSGALIMGNPIGLGLFAHSATVGNPSTTYKDASGLNDYLQTEVMLINGAINTGSKGAPLINADGKIVGMILSKYLISGGAHVNDTVLDMGFAAKSDDILELIELTKEIL